MLALLLIISAFIVGYAKPKPKPQCPDGTQQVAEGWVGRSQSGRPRTGITIDQCKYYCLKMEERCLSFSFDNNVKSSNGRPGKSLCVPYRSDRKGREISDKHPRSDQLLCALEMCPLGTEQVGKAGAKGMRQCAAAKTGGSIYDCKEYCEEELKGKCRSFSFDDNTLSNQGTAKARRSKCVPYAGASVRGAYSANSPRNDQLLCALSGGIGDFQCGFKIRSTFKKDCYLNAGHRFDRTQTYEEQEKRHGLDDENEYNAMWQCAGSTAGRIWYYEGGEPGTRLFTILPNRDGEFQEFFLGINKDDKNDKGKGLGVFKNEWNAKVDQKKKGAAKVWIQDTKKKNVKNLVLKRKGKVYAVLERGSGPKKCRKYNLVTGARRSGCEAVWQDPKYDKKNADNAVQLIPYPCETKLERRDIDPILDYPISDNPNPESLIIEIPGGISQYVAILGVLLVVTLICAFYSICSWYKGKSNKAIYKAVKFDSETETEAV